MCCCSVHPPLTPPPPSLDLRSRLLEGVAAEWPPNLLLILRRMPALPPFPPTGPSTGTADIGCIPPPTMPGNKRQLSRPHTGCPPSLSKPQRLRLQSHMGPTTGSISPLQSIPWGMQPHDWAGASQDHRRDGALGRLGAHFWAALSAGGSRGTFPKAEREDPSGPLRGGALKGVGAVAALAQSSWAHPATVGAGQQGKEERGEEVHAPGKPQPVMGGAQNRPAEAQVKAAEEQGNPTPDTRS
jgi:hypothetical protein